ncbi:hypothetical protein Fmac_026291 [Flemingia macrophylla]|uniref:Dynein light chain n=1 Tax=Flemingia macrophylla TaxID=520843 RepID=A0ABD1LEF4_9FABA
MAHQQRRNLEPPQSNPNPDNSKTYKPSFLVKQLTSLNLSHNHKTHKHSHLIDAHMHAKAMTTSTIVIVPAKKTHKEKPQRDLEREKLGEPKEKSKSNPQHDDVVVERVSVSVPAGGRRRSFCGSQADLRDFFAINGAKMVSVDMPPFMQIHAVDCARKTLDSMEKFTSRTLALSLKKEFDGVYGPAWHCIVGTSFGSFVTHSVGGFLYFSMDKKLYILLFKTLVQKAGSS